MRRRGLPDPLLVISDGAPGLIRAIEECFPRSARQRCLAHKLRNLQSKVPEDQWTEFKARAIACYQPPRRRACRPDRLSAVQLRDRIYRWDRDRGCDNLALARVEFKPFPSGQARMRARKTPPRGATRCGVSTFAAQGRVAQTREGVAAPPNVGALILRQRAVAVAPIADGL
jgi:hypothetical protein